MKTCAVLTLCGVSLALASAALADPVSPASGFDGLPPNRIVAMVRATGLDPIGRPARNGEIYLLRALDPYDVEYRLVIDARTGRTMSIREIAMPGPYRAVPAYGVYDRPIYGRIFGPPEAGFGYPRPPRLVPTARPVQPPRPSESGSNPKTTISTANNNNRSGSISGAPLPRPRPYVMEATSSIPAAPKSAEVLQHSAPPADPETQKTAGPPQAPGPPQAAETPKGNGGAEMPPVAPLD